MVRRLLILLIFALSASGTTRYVTDRAASPVQWMEWAPAAFARAKREKRPLFVSIGYAASWDCQRMQREAFLNGENAEALNAYFVPVLLDRIEYPEVAETYEAVLRSMAGDGRWPANVMLTPDLEPFAGGWFMSTAELNRMLVINANRWASERPALIAEAQKIIAKTRASAEPRAPMDVDATTIEAVVDDIARTYEKEKTLDAMTAAFLFRYAARTKHEAIRALAVDTLRTLAAGPMRDQLGGGFHRCPACYEKMLPDQALFAMAYLDAWQLTRDPDLAHVARTTLDYVVRDLFPPRGLFQSAQDAHSLVPGQGPVFVEGAFYLWEKEPITRLLGRETAGKIFKLYGLKDDAPTRPVLEDPRFLHETYDELAEPLQKMLDVRQKRPAPFREVAMAGWNGLMISALARGAAVLDKPEYLEAATRAATLASTKLWNAQKKTLDRSESHTPALAEDYAMLVQGLLDLFDSGHDVKWLDLAITLQQRQDALFWDASLGRYATGTSVPKPVRGLLSERDEETPAVNSVATMNLLRLAALTGNETWRARPAMIFQSFGGRLRTAGALHPQLAAAYESSLIAPSIVVVIGNEVPREIYERWEPMRAVVFVPRKRAVRDRIVKTLPFIGALAGDPARTVTYVCTNGACR
ncbi:MAG: thioredoxin domain-containing protein [Thermoanaerobaculia bacterium]